MCLSFFVSRNYTRLFHFMVVEHGYLSFGTESLLQVLNLLCHTFLLNKAESTRSHYFYLRWFRLWQDRTRFLSTPTVVRERYPERINFEEIKPALVSTFSTMHDTGLISEYDDQFVEKFVQAFERELAHQSACKCS